MKMGVLFAIFLRNIIDGINQFFVVPKTKHFANGHHLPFAGTIGANPAGKFDFSAQVVIKRHAFEPGVGHGDQHLAKAQQFMGIAFALAFTDFKSVFFGGGFVHTGFLPKGVSW